MNKIIQQNVFWAVELFFFKSGGAFYQKCFLILANHIYRHNETDRQTF